METHISLSILTIVFIAFSAISSYAEASLLSVNEAKLSQLAAKAPKRSKHLEKISRTNSMTLLCIRVAAVFSLLLACAFATVNTFVIYVQYLSSLLYRAFNITNGVLSIFIALVLMLIIVVFFTILFAELISKKIAAKRCEKSSFKFVIFVSRLSLIFAPLAFVVSGLSKLILKPFGINPDNEGEKVTEEEIRLMVDAGSEDGSIEEEEKEIIQNVFEFNDLTAGEISTHRTDIAVLSTEDTAQEWEQTIHDTRHTFFPVCSDSIDKIVGVLNAKDYFRLDAKSIENVMKVAVKPPYLVPETVGADVLLRNMRNRKEYFAIVMDEYGGTNGIVTLTDLIQCIVGDIEYADEDGDETSIPEIEQLDETTFAVTGLAPLSDVEKAIDRTLDEHDCDTIGGYILSVIGSIPEDRATLTTENDLLFIEVTEVKDHRIEKAIIKLKELSAENKDE